MMRLVSEDEIYLNNQWRVSAFYILQRRAVFADIVVD